MAGKARGIDLPRRLVAAFFGGVLVAGLLAPGVALAASPTVTINQAAGQADPTGTGPVNFTAVFSEAVTGFATGDVLLSGTAGATTAIVTGGPSTYTIAVSGMTTTGTVVASIPAGVAQNASSEPNVASTSSDNSVSFLAPPTVTINQAAGQADPTGTAPINFTVVFSQAVTGFVTGDVVFTGSTAGGALVGTVTGSGTTYNVAVSGMTTGGAIVASIPAGVAVDAVSNPNVASTSSDNSVTWAPGGPSVSVNQAFTQSDPTATSPVNFTVVFNAAVTGFATGDVALSGSAGATTAIVTGGPATYNVAVSGMVATGTVVVTIPADVALDASNRPNLASTSSDNSVTFLAPPTVTINQAAGQADPTGTSPINFAVVFSQAVTGFATGDVLVTGTAGGVKTATVTGSGTTYNVAVTGMTTTGTVIATIPAGVAVDVLNSPNVASTSTDNSVAWAPGGPSVAINQAISQADPTATSPINFTVVFSAAVTGFATGDVSISGTAGGTKTATVTGSGTTYNVAVTGMTSSGTVIATIPADVAVDASDRPNLASTSIDNVVTWSVGPTVTINQAAGQADPTGTSPINFTVVFSAAVTGFQTGDVSISGTAGGVKTATVTGSGTTYNVAVTGMTTTGTVIATIPAGVALDGSNRPNFASTSTDNTVTWVPGPSVAINQAISQADPTATSPINFTVVFSAAVTGFATGDVSISGTAGGTKTATVTGSGTTYNVAVTGMTSSGTVIATIPAGVAVDASNRLNLASTSTDNTVTWTGVATSLTVIPSASTITWGQAVTLTIRFNTSGGGNRQVELWGARDNRNPANFARIVTLTTNSAGVATYPYTPPTNLYYEARFLGGSGLSAGTSPQARVVVRQIALLRPTNNGAIKSVSRGTRVNFTTTVRPSRPELTPATVTYWVFRKVSGNWQQYYTANVMADSAGLARFSWTFSSSGTWYVRSMANPTPYNANSVKVPIEQYRVP